jgi:hypothetical protein
VEQMPRTSPRIRGSVAFAGLCCIGLAVNACSTTGNSSTKQPSPERSVSESPSPPSPDAMARNQVLAAYEGMRTQQKAAYAKGTSAGTTLTTYAQDKALAKIQGELIRYHAAHITFTGGMVSRAKVTALDLSSTPHKATVTECADISKWRAMQNGKDVTSPDQVNRFTVTGAVRTIGSRWTVVDFTVDKAHAC